MNFSKSRGFLFCSLMFFVMLVLVSASVSAVDVKIINSVTLNGGSSATVSSNGSVVVVVNGTVSGGPGADWKATQYQIGSHAAVCRNIVDQSGTTYIDSFTINAPVVNGTYNFTVIMRNKDDCTGAIMATSFFPTGIIVTPPQTCGNNITEGTEQCDGGSCCNLDCTFKSSSTICRVASGSCDLAETCTGSSASCPSNSFKTLGTSCTDGSYCNGLETCDGSGSCQSGTSVSCSANDSPEINTCDNTPDGNPFTLDTRNPFTSVCVEDGVDSGHCTSAGAITSTCDLSCGAECILGSSDSCVAEGGYAGTKDCNAGCLWNSCSATEFCGDSVVNGPEVCDGGSQSCTTTEGYSGSQSCSAGCGGFDTCSSTDFCGDSITNGPEICDDGVNNGIYGYCDSTCTGPAPDITAPIVSVSGNMTVEATSSSGANVNFEANATDNADGFISASCSPLPGSLFALGTTIVTCSATDAAGNTGTNSFSVTVQDTTSPVIENYSTVIAEATSSSGANVNFDLPVASDIVDGTDAVTCDYNSGDTFALGTTTVTCDSKDSAGNSASSITFDVVVQDTTAPTTTARGTLEGMCASSISRVCDNSYEFGTWTNKTVQVALTCSDSVSGCTISYLVNGESTGRYEIASSGRYPTFSEPGIYNITYYSTDGEANVEVANSVIIKIVTPSAIGGEFEFNDGDSAENATNVTSYSDLTISIPNANGTSTVFLPAGTTISMADGSGLNLSSLSYGNVSLDNLSNLGSGIVAYGAVQWGIPNLGLVFSNPITIRIYLGLEYEGQTLGVLRSSTGSSGWTSDGIVDPKTCLVTLGYCEFNTTKASYFASTTVPVAAVSTSSGGGGGGSYVAPKKTSSNSTGQNVSAVNAPEAQSVPENTASNNQPQQGVLSGITGAVIGTLGTTGTVVAVIFIVVVIIAWIVMSRRKKVGTKNK